MLIYHPAYDAYHCAFRVLLAVETLQSVDVSKLRILDFYLAFPAEVLSITLPKEFSHIRRIAQPLRNEYHGPLNSRKTFLDMQHIFTTAVRALVASSLLDKEKLDGGIAERTRVPIPKEFREVLESARDREPEVTDFILSKLGGLPTTGVGGLKARTGLLEHRYDFTQADNSI